MRDINIRLNNEESILIKEYCKKHHLSVPIAFKNALFEKIEDEFDLIEYDNVKEHFDKNPVSYSLNEVREKLNIKKKEV